MPVTIQETIVTPGTDGDVVQLHISDVPPGDESATFVLRILAKPRSLMTPTLAHVLRQAMAMAQEALTPLLQKLASEIQEAGYGLQLPPKNPR